MKKSDGKIDYMQGVRDLTERIAVEAKTLKSLEANLEKVVADKTRAEAARRDCAYAALTPEDAETLKRLESAEEILAKSDQRVRSVEIALESSRQKLEGLNRQRKAAEEQAAADERDDIIRVRLFNAAFPKIEQGISLVLEGLKEVGEAERPIFNLTAQANQDPGRYGELRKQVWNHLKAALDMNINWRSRDAEQKMTRPLTEIFKRQFGRAFREENEVKIAS